tara:strand:+ start:3007 stop:3546 length:540 start_codon:yes stop_codon:yes gene_type:complete
MGNRNTSYAKNSTLNRFFLMFLLILSSFAAYGHKYYVSIAELEYNAEKNRIEGSLKMTAHDFEEVLEAKFGKRMEIENIADTSAAGIYMKTYLTDHFKLYSGGKQSMPLYIGKEVTVRQELYFYFTLTSIVNPKEVKITNTILFAQFAQQQNIVHYKYKEQTKSVTLVSSKKHGKITFD